ncbi:Ribonuclease VapC [Hyella patelloides LEGE 07179]|uniref:Ribonuclease VapC n=1 Tax=Hyella patelloides LEGE 07179 TaxID=945734 RepID=A0A563VRY8_9CYAN|nr:PIN domain-containing protein [Hyella patelloides]VEP14152.1 Ribonuclease VapC [Hyella patelloides LEGE 07179]
MGQLVIPSGSKVYIDTVVAIYSVEWNAEYFELLQPLWLKFQSEEIELISSELILMETLVLPVKNEDSLLINAYEELLLSEPMQLIPIDQSILRRAANLRATNSIKTPDAIHAATAMSVNCDLFITNDKGFRNLDNLPVVILSEVLAS